MIGSPLTSESIENMSYNELIGIVRETNRPPGGRQTLLAIAHRAFLTERSRVLEIGTSTGWTSIELARLAGCSVTGIDINEDSLEEARIRSRLHGLQNVRFLRQDVRCLDLQDECFDLVFCGNVLSLVDDRDRAWAECTRVLRYGGIIAAVPMYYVDRPDMETVRAVREAIRVEIPVSYRREALSAFQGRDLEMLDAIDYRFERVGPEDVSRFVKTILERPHLARLESGARTALARRYESAMQLFGRNLSYMGYTVLLLRRTRFQEDPELFIGRRCASGGTQSRSDEDGRNGRNNG